MRWFGAGRVAKGVAFRLEYMPSGPDFSFRFWWGCVAWRYDDPRLGLSGSMNDEETDDFLELRRRGPR